jgi:hypothetical protein
MHILNVVIFRMKELELWDSDTTNYTLTHRNFICKGILPLPHPVKISAPRIFYCFLTHILLTHHLHLLKLKYVDYFIIIIILSCVKLLEACYRQYMTEFFHYLKIYIRLFSFKVDTLYNFGHPLCPHSFNMLFPAFPHFSINSINYYRKSG